MSQPKIIISGGGTGGHIFPAIAIANEIKSRYPRADILFVGALGKMEMDKVPAAGYRIEGLPITGLQRKLSLSNLLLPFRLLSSIIKAGRIIKNFKPDVVVGVGGYASAAVLYAATRRKIPTLIQEQNSYAGLTNKWLGKKVNRVCVAYENMQQFFPEDKIVITGNPVRKEITQALSITPEEARKKIGFNSEKKLILSVGGSLGARTINHSIKNNLGLLDNTNIQLLWQTGQFYKADTEGKTNVQAQQFISDMTTAYAAADIVISRAGAISISELSILGKACILVPSPNVAEDHQTKNAMALSEKNAAVLIRDAEANERLLQTAITLVDNETEKEKLSDNISKFAKPDALVNIVDQIKQLTKWT